jgi:hypothetical protein
MGILTVTTVNPAQSEGLSAPSADLVSSQQQADIALQIRQTTRDAEALFAERDEADLLNRLKPGSWSAVECLDHLTQTTCAFLPAISDAIAVAPKLKQNRCLRTGILPSLFIRILNPPYRIRFRALPQLAPQNASSEKAWGSFVESQEQLLLTLDSTAGLAIDKVRVTSPVYARITYNIYGAFRMLAAHQRHHLWQIGQILNTLDEQRTPASPKYSA